MKTFCYLLLALVAIGNLGIPDLAFAAGGKAEMLIVVADNRMVESSFTKFWIEQYNHNPFMFGVWCTLFTGFLGVTLGFITDRIMRHTGLDLTSRKIVEH